MPNPRSLVGKLLLKSKSKGSPKTSDTPQVTPTPKTDPEAGTKLAQGRQQMQSAIDKLPGFIDGLPFNAIKLDVGRKQALFQQQMDQLDTLDSATQAQRLMQVGDGCKKVVTLARQQVEQVEEALKVIVPGSLALKHEIEVLDAPIARPPLLERLKQLDDKRDKAKASADVTELLSITKLEAEIEALRKDVRKTKADLEASTKAKQLLMTGFIEVRNEINKLDMAAARDPHVDSLDKLIDDRDKAAAGTDLTAFLGLPKLVEKLTALREAVKQTKTALDSARSVQKTKAVDPLKIFRQALGTKVAPVKAALAGDLAWADKLASDVQALVDAPDKWPKVDEAAQKVKDACAAMTLRMNSLVTVAGMAEGAPKNLAKLTDVHAQAVKTLADLKSHPDHGAAFQTVSSGLQTKINTAKLLIDAGNGANATAVANSLKDLTPEERAARKSLATYEVYNQLRKQVDDLLVTLGKHTQKDTIKAEISGITRDKTDAHGKGPAKGWHYAKVALEPVLERAKDALALADKVEAKKAQLPAITQALTTKGHTDKAAKLAQVAIKMMVEEDCSVDDAVKMAESADQYEADGLSEIDAGLSARVKQSLTTGTDAISPERAHTIGKVVRCKGTAKAEDLKAVAKDLKRFPEGALKALDQAGAQSVVCRGPVTEAFPDLHDVIPRGWPQDMTWDDVPGVGGSTSFAVGTMDDGAGGRKVPGPGEGPVRHGTPDLLGHEGGHTLDTMGGANRRNLPAFLSARTLDKNLGTDAGLKPGRDDYFMSKTESPSSVQTQDAAHSETFAESFALHCQANTTKWPNLMTFWSNYVW